MYECVGCRLSSSSIPQLGLGLTTTTTTTTTSNGASSIFSNGQQHFPKSNLNIVRSTRRNPPFSWHQYLYQNPTGLEQKQKIQQPTPSLDFVVGEKQKQDDDDDDVLSIVKRSKTRPTIKSSNLIAKQVISLHSALTLGFVSQLWVDVSSWLVVVVEVRPNLLSGQLERFLLEDVMQVGDVVLVKDESVVENEFKLVGLETLVGYNVVTPGRRKIGKVRGYSFNVDSGAVELLELDSFGISVIPSTLVSTYALFIEDVLEVGSDTVVVHEAAAASRIQRLTKGLFGTENIGNSINEFDEYPEPKRQHAKSKFRIGKNRNLSSGKLHPEMAEAADDWELPMDYL